MLEKKGYFELCCRKLTYDGLPHGQISQGLQTEMRVWDDQSNSDVITKNTFNAEGMLVSVQDPNGNVNSIEYDSYVLYPSVKTNPLGWETYTEYDYRFGKPVKITDPNTVTYEVAYDDFGRLNGIWHDSVSSERVRLITKRYIDNSFPHAVETIQHQ
jgi:YD repeat-containing protein